MGTASGQSVIRLTWTRVMLSKSPRLLPSSARPDGRGRPSLHGNCSRPEFHSPSLGQRPIEWRYDLLFPRLAPDEQSRTWATGKKRKDGAPHRLETGKKKIGCARPGQPPHERD